MGRYSAGIVSFKSHRMLRYPNRNKKRISEALDVVAAHLGNTRTVCKKYYVHPVILSLYESKKIEHYISELDEILINDNKSDLTAEEKVLMKILEAN